MRSVYMIVGKHPRMWVTAVMALSAILLYGGVNQLLEDRTVLTFSGVIQDKVVAIDPGHGGEDGGAKGTRGTQEKVVNLLIAKKVVDQLNQAGGKAILTRENEDNVSVGPWSQRSELTKRVEKAQGANALVYVSIHANSFPMAPACQGPQTFYQPGSAEGKRLALHIQKEMTKRVGNKDGRQAKAEDYFVLRMTKCPAVMVETGFLSNAAEEALLLRDDYQEKLAQGIATGIARYLGGEPAEEPKGAATDQAPGGFIPEVDRAVSPGLLDS
ncbi:hypothetical protein GTO89_03325 [Heliobacterium gestii]|uniref:MurNAc-LAA domain-containing protein n=1 Tax=Heliomicrobium gestii TaxID=2699 RepID=A0A845LGS9_HELGE|nr:N-acetylmuramoyl-L-alanine amidase [Heliomicrobium gestii]MBM7865825.1 N-acetylmuramoyl-L-alanine amidase [Heliomicrobium gestii]MZP42066.1 hypothetical protein [Heliomicrobium gestii]